MKIAVNTRLLRKNQLTGIGIFSFETMSRIAKKHPEHTFYYIFDQKYDNSFITSNNIIPIIARPKSRHKAFFLLFWFEFILPRILNKIKPDIFISPDGFMSLRTTFRSIIVIHDLNFEHYPTFLPKSISKFYRIFTPKYCRKAKRIITVSDFTKKDIQNKYTINSDKIDVVYNGANISYMPLSDEEKKLWKDKNTDGYDFFIFIGMIHPRKNLANQLKAFDIFCENKNNKNHKFYIVGERWIWDTKLEETYTNMKNKKHIIFVGRISSEELGKAIGSATALMYVSLFEGFGIPILESFFTETPVITSNVSSMPEVAKNAAIFVDPENPYEISEAMTEIVNNIELRKKLIEAGKNRKDEFSWDKTADLFWESINKLN
jgi:glycosyltransferase involved in cell wall biosynthesis